MTTFPAGKSGNPVPAVSQDAKAKEKLPPPTIFAPSGLSGRYKLGRINISFFVFGSPEGAKIV